MNNISRYNYQRGVPQDLAHDYTTYKMEIPLDRYILTKKSLYNYLNNKELEETEQEIAENVGNKIIKMLDDVFN